MVILVEDKKLKHYQISLSMVAHLLMINLDPLLFFSRKGYFWRHQTPKLANLDKRLTKETMAFGCHTKKIKLAIRGIH